MADLHIYTVKKPDGTSVKVEAPSVTKAATKLGTTVFESTITRADVGCVVPPTPDVRWSEPAPQVEPEKKILPIPPGETLDKTTLPVPPDYIPPRRKLTRGHRIKIKPVDTRKYTITLPSGKTKTFDTVTYEEAVLRAKQWEAAAGSLKDIGAGKPLSAYVVKASIRGAQMGGRLSYAKALVKYGLAPAGVIAMRDAKTKEVVFIEKAAWDATPDKYKKVALASGFGALQALLDKEARIAQTQESEVQRTLGKLQLMGCGQVIPKTDKPTEDEGDGRVYDLVSAIQQGFDIDKLEVAFGEDAVEKAQRVVKAIKKLGDDSPAWALMHNKITKEEIELIYGEQAAKWLSDKKRQEEAHKTLSHLGIEDQGKKIVAALILGQFLLSAGAEQMAYNVQWVRLSSIALVAAIPSGVSKVAATIPLRVGVGVAAGLAGGAYLLTFLTGLPLNVKTPAYTKNFYDASKNAIIALPGMVLADPVGMTSELAGFILGPQGAYKLARAIGTKASPYYVPNTAVRFTFSTAKLSLTNGQVANAIKSGKITAVQVANAMSRAMSKSMKSSGIEPVWVKIGKSNIRINVEPTPGMKFMGGALWHASPSKAAYKALDHIVSAQGSEPASFYSLYAAPRFAMMSARGTPATSPCLVMLYTKAGKLRAYPTSVQYARTLSAMQAKGFNYLGSGKAGAGAYGPIKTYAGRFELEAMLPNGMKMNRVTNLRTRLLGASAGEFVTTVDGWVMPIYRFAEKGASVPKVGIAQLAAIRVANVTHALKVLIGKKGLSTQAGYVAVRTLVEQFEVIGRAAMGSLKGAVANAAYNRAIDKTMVERIEALYKEHNPVALEKAWRKDPTRFEDAYLESMARLQARATGYRTEDALYRRDSSYVTAEIRYSEPYLRARADDLERALYRARQEYRGERTAMALRGQPRPPRETPRISRVPYVPPRVPPRVPPHFPPRYPPVPVTQPKYPLLAISGGGKPLKVPPGSITWRQGNIWKFIPPPYAQAKPITLREAPEGAKRTSERTPEQTIQMIGKSRVKVPKTVSVDLGVVDILIEGYGKRISYTGKGETTIAGRNVPGPTKGMSVPATAPMPIATVRGQKYMAYSKLAFGTSLRSLTAETYDKDIPKTFADKVLSQKLGKMSSRDIALEIKASKVLVARKTEILKLLPDRVRKQTELWLSIDIEYAPTRGFPKAAYMPTLLRRKKKVSKSKEIVPVVMSAST